MGLSDIVTQAVELPRIGLIEVEQLVAFAFEFVDDDGTR
jgi:hypothetical protein